jgi:hypothetical protein
VLRFPVRSNYASAFPNNGTGQNPEVSQKPKVGQRPGILVTPDAKPPFDTGVLQKSEPTKNPVRCRRVGCWCTLVGNNALPKRLA